YDLWVQLRKLIDWVCDHWKDTDEGVWEVRGGARHFVYSKVMCWVALDRGLRLADQRSFPADRERWLAVRDAICDEIMVQGWNRERNAFVQSYGSDCLDASVLMMPLVFFVSPTDERMLSTLDAVLQPTAKAGLVSNSLVYRYNTREAMDGLRGEEGTFNICTFWLVEALTRAGRSDPARPGEAPLMFEEMLRYANHPGLYAEEGSPRGQGPARRGARELPASLHASRAHQRRLQSRPHPGGAPVARPSDGVAPERHVGDARLPLQPTRWMDWLTGEHPPDTERCAGGSWQRP